MRCVRKLFLKFFIVLVIILAGTGFWLWKGGLNTVTGFFANMQPVAEAAWTEKVILKDEVSIQVPFKLKAWAGDHPMSEIMVARSQFRAMGSMMGISAFCATWLPGRGPTAEQLADAAVDLLKKKQEFKDLTVTKTNPVILGGPAVEIETEGTVRGLRMRNRLLHFQSGDTIYVLGLDAPADRGESGAVWQKMKDGITWTRPPADTAQEIGVSLDAAPQPAPVPPIQRGSPGLPAGMERRKVGDAVPTPPRR